MRAETRKGRAWFWSTLAGNPHAQKVVFPPLCTHPQITAKAPRVLMWDYKYILASKHINKCRLFEQ